MKYNFDEYVDRRGSNSVKWDAGVLAVRAGVFPQFNEETIPIFIADMDFRCAQPIVDAVCKVARHGVYGYPSYEANTRYIPAIQRWFRDRHNWEIPADSVFFIHGTLEALQYAALAYSEVGDGVLVTYPVYGQFMTQINQVNRKVVNSRLIENNGYYTMDFEDIEKKCALPEVKLFFLCSPQNPVGRVWTAEELKTLSDICVRNNVVLVSDEVHCNLLRKGQKFISAGAVCDSNNTVVFNSISKSFNCAGLSVTHGVIQNEDMRNRFLQVMGYTAPSPFAIEALIAAYTEGDEWMDQVNEYIDGNFDMVLDLIEKKMPYAKAFRAEGTYMLWLDLRGTGLSPQEITDRIGRGANVALEGGQVFDPEHIHDSFQRVCLSSRRALINEAFEKIAAQFE